VRSVVPVCLSADVRHELAGIAAGVVAACGAAATVLEYSQLHALESTVASVAIVAAAAAGPSDRDLAAVRRLARQGFGVISLLDGAQGPALAGACRLLLAGCGAVVDSARPGMRDELMAHVVAALAAGADRAAETARRRQRMDACGMVGESRAMIDLFGAIQRLSALSDISTVIIGETGTGKERVARALHALDAKRRGHPFIAVNCGAITPSLAESELFGHCRGAFTHAHRDRKGLIRAADKGVLFLDEIGELDASIQTKLLRVLQEGRVLAVGDDADVAVDVRVVAATNRPLRQMVADGQFRADLYHRLNVCSLTIPPLRERRSDIPSLVEHFVRLHGRGRGASTLAPDAAFLEAMTRLDLPGNARQLENLVRRALAHHDGGGPLDLCDLPADVWNDVVAAAAIGASRTGAASEDVPPSDLAWMTYPARVLAAHSWDLSRSLEACERSMIEAALRETDGNRSRAARILGITPRSVYKKLRRYRPA
jgi:two-component system, NtrC family, response regulator HydG